jgi:hypothetical protein
VRFTDVGENTDNTTVIIAATITLSTRAQLILPASTPKPATAKRAMISQDTSSSVGPRSATGKHHHRARYATQRKRGDIDQ